MEASGQELTIRDFAAGDQAAFRRLNEEWIVHYFAMEPKDEEVLTDPESKILNRGGRILFAVRGGEVVGCCALLAMGDGEFEVGKMAVAPTSRGKGVGRLLLSAVIDAARASGATRLYLETNRMLGTAIRLYESAGFQHLPPERVTPSPYARSDIAMELLL